MSQEQTPYAIESMDEVAALFGPFDEHIRVIASELNVDIAMHDGALMIQGPQEQVSLAKVVLDKLVLMLRRGEALDKSRIRYAISLAEEGNADWIEEMLADVVAVTHKGKQIRCKTLGQRKYVDNIRKNTLTFGIGPAGTGKTYLAMAMAVLALKNKEISRIVLTRPAVEAGERLGFLPGDLQEKVNPYLRPLYDALHEMVGVESYQKLAERGVIEVAPLAYMRGRTLNESFIILDEAQNTTSEQMMMFLTRFGQGSRVVVTGDITQVDLPAGKRSGLVEAAEVLRGVEDIAFSYLTHRDVVRHELVQNIIRAYEKHTRRREGN